jgi:glucokinase
LQPFALLRDRANPDVPEYFVMILAGDIGATNTRIGLFRREREALIPVKIRVFKNRQYSGLDPILEDFLSGVDGIEGACFGVAGPVFDGKAFITNLRWNVDSEVLRLRLKTPHVSLINDVEATGFGIASLVADDLLTLNERTTLDGAPAALIAAGTGLGEAILIPRGATRVPFPTESGHADFAPTNPLQCDFLRHLWGKYQHVSWDRILSGPGLLMIYQFLRESNPSAERKVIAERMRTEDPSAVIAEAALNGDCELCVAALDFFACLLGAESGNLALRALARGGIYLCGGIAPKIQRKLSDGRFMSAFVDKGRMREFLEDIPVHIVLNDQTALLGAAAFAMLNGNSSRNHE